MYICAYVNTGLIDTGEAENQISRECKRNNKLTNEKWSSVLDEMLTKQYK